MEEYWSGRPGGWRPMAERNRSRRADTLPTPTHPSAESLPPRRASSTADGHDAEDLLELEKAKRLRASLLAARAAAADDEGGAPRATTSAAEDSQINTTVSRARASRRRQPPTRRPRRKSAAEAVVQAEMQAERAAAAATRACEPSTQGAADTTTPTPSSDDRGEFEARLGVEEQRREATDERLRREGSAREARVEAAWRKTLSYRLRGQLEAPEQWKMQHLIAESRRVWNLQKVMAASRIWEERDKVGSMKGPMRKRKENAGGRVGKLSSWDRVTTHTLSFSLLLPRAFEGSWPILADLGRLRQLISCRRRPRSALNKLL
eukprot:COSAG04_NODE_597_length_12254_cov_13.866591_12_plen_321_part_00